jgi:PAS domain S-box-containing protein
MSSVRWERLACTGHGAPQVLKWTRVGAWMSKWAGGGPAGGEPFAWEEAAQAIERLARGAALVTSELDFSRVIEEIVAQTVRLGARSAGLYLADDERREIRYASQRGIPDEVIEKARVVSYDAPLLIARCAATRQLQVLEDVEALPPENVFARYALALIGSRSSCAAPLVAHGQLIAVLSWSFVEPRRFSPLERAAIEAVADVFAVGLANARTHEREQHLRRAMEAIREATLAISEEVELGRVLTQIADHACRIAGARQGVIRMMGTGPAGCTVWATSGAAGAMSLAGPSSTSLLAAITRDPRSFRVARAADGAWRYAIPEGVPPESPVLIVPMFHRNEVLAALCLIGKEGGGAFSEDDQHAVEQLAQYAGIAIEHACLQEQLHRELRERRQAEETLALAQRIAHLGNWEWDVDSGWLRWSDEIYRILGAQPKAFEATLDAFLAYVHPEDQSRVREAALATIHGQQPFHIEHRIVRPDGSERLVEEQGEVLRDQRGRALRMIGTVLDITDRKRIEAALRESEERFRLAIDNAPIGMALIGLQGHFLRVNRALCELLGYSPEELVRLGFQDVTHPEDRATGRAIAERLWAGAIPRIQLTKRYLRKDGEIIRALLHMTVVRDAAGRAVCGVAQLEDITARERAQEEHERLLADVASERRLLRTVIDRSPTGIALVAPGGRWILANPQATRLLGEPRRPSPGTPMLATRLLRSDRTLLPDEEVPSIRTLRGESLAGEEYLLERHGQYIPIRVRTAPVRDPDGKLIAAVLVLEDLTTAKEYERLREEWMSVVAHDLRQPVATITLYAHALARSATPADGIKLEHILVSAERLRRMISDLLDSSLIEAHRLELHRKLVDVGHLAAQVAERSAMGETAPMRTVIRGPLPLLEVDPVRFEQVLANLLSNARKYGYPGTEVIVEVELKDEEVEVAVLNHGDPIPPEVLPYLFSRFHRAQPTKNKGVGGLGLGLYIARGLVEAHGGRIWAESPPRGLTAFRLRLPLPGATPRDE